MSKETKSTPKYVLKTTQKKQSSKQKLLWLESSPVFQFVLREGESKILLLHDFLSKLENLETLCA